ncbi:MAG: hypothetical protein KJ630_11525, partial [Proteobacteria bacterium]|nr:hypothetical protein [Pseudomonadota bacterium]
SITHYIQNKVTTHSYIFTPYLETLFSKGRHKPPRLISIPTIRDKITLTAINRCLQYHFPSCVRESLPNTIIQQIKECLENSNDTVCIRKYDLANFYPSIDKGKLFEEMEKNVPLKELLLIKNALNTPTVPKGTKRCAYDKFSTTGVPQGLSISNILAEIYIHDIDVEMKKNHEYYWRYVDDILIICSDSNEATEADKTLSRLIKDKALALSEEKSKKCSIKEKFSFLGYQFVDKKVTVRDSSFERHIQKISDIFSWYQKNKKENVVDYHMLFTAFIDSLNERITGAISSKKRYGWLFYYSEITDKTVLYRLDNIVKRKLLALPEVEQNGIPQALKRSTRAFHEIKHSPFSGYIHDHCCPVGNRWYSWIFA